MTNMIMMIPATDPKPSQRGHPWKENGWEEKGVCSCLTRASSFALWSMIISLWKRTNLETNLGAPRLLEFPAECPNIFFSFTSTWKKTSIWSRNSSFLCKIWGRHWNQDHDDHCQKKVRPQKIFARGNWGWRMWRWQALVSSACPT